jgi:beta-glucosidase
MTMRRALIGLLLSASAAPLHAAPAQPELETRAKKIITIKGLRFKDLNANGSIDAYEDWRLSAQKRAADLVRRMTLAEKAGMMLIATNNPDCGGGISDRGRDLIDTQKMSRFILRAKVNTQAPDCSVKFTLTQIRRRADHQAFSRRWPARDGLGPASHLRQEPDIHR